MQIQFIEQEASKFFEAATMVRTQTHYLKGSLFPAGCCKAMSFLFAMYLIQKEVLQPKDIAIVTGMTWDEPEGENGSHLWLEINDYIVDLTAKQFPDAPAGIIIGKIKDWHHHRFISICRHTYNDDLNERSRRHYEADLALLKAGLNQLQSESFENG